MGSPQSYVGDCTALAPSLLSTVCMEGRTTLSFYGACYCIKIMENGIQQFGKHDKGTLCNEYSH